jgi:glycosyltransferase involved in cell wall biosynthesis
MKILHLLYESRGDYFGIGGVGIRAYQIYKRLKERHEITLLCKKYPGAENGSIEGFDHLFVGVESRSLARTLLSYAYGARSFVTNFGHHYDIVIEEFSPAIPTLLGSYRRRPVVLQIQGYTGRKYFEKYNVLSSAFLYMSERLRPPFYKNVIFVSDVTAQRFNLSESNRRVAVIPNGIPEEFLNVTPGEADYILYLGRIDIVGKGLDVLLEAYVDFVRSCPEVRLLIAGDGRDMKRFKELVRSLPPEVRRNIDFAGWVEGEKKASTLSNALAVVVPSRHEVHPLVALEASACAKPLLVSDIAELTYVTEQGAGMSFRSEDPSSLSDAMKRLLDAAGRKEMGMKGREFVRRYAWERIAGEYEKFICGIV